MIKISLLPFTEIPQTLSEDDSLQNFQGGLPDMPDRGSQEGTFVVENP